MFYTSFLLESVLGLTAAGAIYKLVKNENEKHHREENTIVYRKKGAENDFPLYVPNANRAGIKWLDQNEDQRLIIIHLLIQEYDFEDITNRDLEIREVVREGESKKVEMTKAWYKEQWLNEKKKKAMKRPEESKKQAHPDQKIIDYLVRTGFKKREDITPQDIATYKKFKAGNGNASPLNLFDL